MGLDNKDKENMHKCFDKKLAHTHKKSLFTQSCGKKKLMVELIYNDLPSICPYINVRKKL